MKILQRSLIFLLVVLPMGLGLIVPTGPESFAFLNSSRSAAEAKAKGDRKTEIFSLQVIAANQPWRKEVWEQIAALQFVTGDYQAAIQTYQTAASLGTLSAKSLFNEGKAWNAIGDQEKAKMIYRAASGTNSEDVSFYLELANSQEDINDSIGTLATLLRAYGLTPEDKGINYALGVQFAASQPDNALKFLNNAAADGLYAANADALILTIQTSDPLGESASRYIYIGQELSQIGEWQAAASAFTKAVSLDGQNGISWALLGEAVQHVGESGFDQLSKALQLNPHSDIVNGLMALYYRRQKKYDIALTYLYKAVENNPNESTWQIEIGNTLALEGDLSDALVHLQVATLSEPGNWVTWSSLATFCITYNYSISPIGLDAARKALLLVPGNPALLDIMGSAYLVTGDLDSAERFYLQALQAAPDQAEILYHLGELYLQEQKKDLAFSYLRSAAEFATDSRIRDNANLLIQQNGGG